MKGTKMPLETEDLEEREARRSRDPEIAIIEKMIRLLEDLEPEARPDAIDYLQRRYRRSLPGPCQA